MFKRDTFQWDPAARSFKPEHAKFGNECKTYVLSLLLSMHPHIYPTPPLGQNMTQGQFLSGV